MQAYWRWDDISPNKRESDKVNSLAIRAVVKSVERSARRAA